MTVQIKGKPKNKQIQMYLNVWEIGTGKHIGKSTELVLKGSTGKLIYCSNEKMLIHTSF